MSIYQGQTWGPLPIQLTYSVDFRKELKEKLMTLAYIGKVRGKRRGKGRGKGRGHFIIQTSSELLLRDLT